MSLKKEFKPTTSSELSKVAVRIFRTVSAIDKVGGKKKTKSTSWVTTSFPVFEKK
jgi:hypothetical protein